MKRQDALYLASCIGTIAFCIVFVMPHFTATAVPWYFPTEHRWELAARPTGLAIDFYGRFIYATVASAVTVAIVLIVARKLRTPRLSPKLASLLAAWALALVILVMMYYAWTLAFRVPIAVELPDWYVPR